MDPTLNDIRLLKLAELYERAYEQFVGQMAELYVKDEHVRAHIRKLAGDTGGHADRVEALLKDMSERVPREMEAAIEHAALLDILEVERAAREFYVKNMENVSDPRAAALFRELAAAEGRHIRLAEGALALSDRRRSKIRLPPATMAALRALDARRENGGDSASG